MVSTAVVVCPLRVAEMVTWPAGALGASEITKTQSREVGLPGGLNEIVAGTDAAAGLLLDSATTTGLLFLGNGSLSTTLPLTWGVCPGSRWQARCSRSAPGAAARQRA